MQRTLGLAMSGGAARGVAHLGVLQAISELQLPIGRLSGVSSGAVAAVFFAAGYAPREVLRLVLETSFVRLLRPALPRSGLLQLDGLEKLYHRLLGPDLTFADLRLPVTINATDLLAGESVFFEEGQVIKPLLATSAVPVLCQPVELHGRLLVDGGLLDNLPIEPLLRRPEVAAVGVNVNLFDPGAALRTVRQVAERTFFLAIQVNSAIRAPQCELLLQPPELRPFRVMDLKRAQEFFDIGYRYTLSRAAELEALLHHAVRPGPDEDFG